MSDIQKYRLAMCLILAVMVTKVLELAHSSSGLSSRTVVTSALAMILMLGATPASILYRADGWVRRLYAYRGPHITSWLAAAALVVELVLYVAVRAA